MRIEVRPAGQVLTPAVEEKLMEVRVAETLGTQVGLEDLALVGNEARDDPTTQEHGPFALVGAVDHGRRLGAAVLGFELQPLRQGIAPAAHANGHGAAGGARLAQEVDLVPGLLQSGQRPVGLRGVRRGQGAGPGVVALAGDVERRGGNRRLTESERHDRCREKAHDKFHRWAP